MFVYASKAAYEFFGDKAHENGLAVSHSST